MSYLSLLDAKEVAEEELTNGEAIRLAYRGELKNAVKLQPLPEWKSAWAGDVWLVPTEKTKQRYSDEYPNDLVLLANEFFHATDLISKQGASAKGAIHALRLFGGTMSDNAPRPTIDPSFDVSPDDSPLWCRLFEDCKDRELVARLRYLRGAGCQLVETSDSYRITPIIDATGCGGWPTLEAYEAEKWCLSAYTKELVALLKKLRAVA